MASQSPPDIPADADEQRALASDLATRADESPEQIDATDVETAVALIKAGRRREDFETAVNAAEVFQHVFEQPSLFDPVVDDLIALSDAYPPDVEGIPAPADWYASEELRTIVYIADGLRRAAQEDPKIVGLHTDALCDVVFSDENTPRHHTFTLGYAATVNPTGVPVSDLRTRLQLLRERGEGNGHPSFAEATLNALDDAGVGDADGSRSASSTKPETEEELLADLGELEDDPDRIAVESELLEEALEADSSPVRVKALELVATAAGPDTVEALPQNEVVDVLRDADDEAVVEAAVEATIALTNVHTSGEARRSKSAVTPSLAVRRLGFALTRLDLDDASFAIADGVAELSDATPDTVETLVNQYIDALDDADDVRYADSMPGAARALAMLATHLPEQVAMFDDEIAGHVKHESAEVRVNVVKTLGSVVRSNGTVSNAVFEALRTALDDDNDTVRRAARDAAPATLATEDEQTARGDATASESDPFANLRTVTPPAGDVALRTVNGSPTVVHSRIDDPESGRTYPAVELLDAGFPSERSADDASEWRLLTTLDSGDAREETRPRSSADASTEADSVVTDENAGERPGAETANTADADNDGEGTRSRVAHVPDVSTARPTEECTYAELTVGDRIGEGGFADVREAWLNDDTRLALKQPKLGETLPQSTFEQFAEEAGTWAKLDDDPHVVTMVGWGQTPRPWIAMEYLDGGDLRARLDSGNELDLAERLWIAAVLAETVANVHHLGVRHLDLKPANVLFERTRGDDWAVPKIGDWGVAKLQIDAEGGTEPLTPAYAAPEQFASGTLDHQTDIYQLGALCYELLTGRTPAEDGVDAANPETSRQVRPPSALQPVLPEGVDEALRSALAFEKRERYDRAVYLRDALRDAFHEVVEGTPDVRP
ncbi:protein kinase (plasmid) [Halarchaeum sp. CBA1220]|uniref:serine/threonine-protein kinase n=1 Tax=Halarchaeum sp. CBA1220 TaxID=1853682 RepID=UPI000F3A98ED|nr:serine/threonine-protein kinase [Halarchaeum sp. CBA1220]QLC35563.1 protein kinase [Halarchaeum sp. CBA1220]